MIKYFKDNTGKYSGAWYYDSSYHSSNDRDEWMSYTQPVDFFEYGYRVMQQNGPYLVSADGMTIDSTNKLNKVEADYDGGSSQSSTSDLYWAEGDIVADITEEDAELTVARGNTLVTYRNINADSISVDMENENYTMDVTSGNASDDMEIVYEFYNNDAVTEITVTPDDADGDFTVSNAGNNIELSGVSAMNVVVRSGTAGDDDSMQVVSEKELTSLLENESYSINANDLFSRSLPNTDATDHRKVFEEILFCSGVGLLLLAVFRVRMVRYR